MHFFSSRSHTPDPDMRDKLRSSAAERQHTNPSSEPYQPQRGSGGGNIPPQPPSGAYNYAPVDTMARDIPQSLQHLSSRYRSDGQRTQYPSPRYGSDDKRTQSSAYHEQPQRSNENEFIVIQLQGALRNDNCLICHEADLENGQHVLINNKCFTVKHGNDIPRRRIAASPFLQELLNVVFGSPVEVCPLRPTEALYLETIHIQLDAYNKLQPPSEAIPVDELANHLCERYTGISMGKDQTIYIQFHGLELTGKISHLSVLETINKQQGGVRTKFPENFGVLMKKTDIYIEGAPRARLKLKLSSKKVAPNAILGPSFKFEDMGIGGLDTEFSEIFRRAFASRVFPPGLVDKLGIQHVKGIILHGPPGTGKTLIARQIGKMLNAREPKIVNGPEILSKYVGASEENIRKLFADAEAEYKQKGDESGLHIIIFDELDAIFKQRGSTSGGTGVGDTVVNQLLSKMDGVDQLNNILIIGMTNRMDMIDEALLRPGRLEVHMEISLPDENGRFQILNIHTNKMRTNKVMENDVDLHKLAALTKNFSGAEISGLIKSATSFAFNRHVKVGTMAGISDDVENLRVNMNDFMNALDEVHPAFGVSEEELEQVVQNGIIRFDTVIEELLSSGRLLVGQVRSSQRTPLVSVLLYGLPGAGKTALAASIAQESIFPFIKLISPDSMVGFTESQKVQAITKIFTDSYKSPLSVVVVDNIERLIDWTPMGARFSNSVLQTLLVLFARRPPKGRRLLIIATSSLRPILGDLGFSETFDSELYVPPITTIASLDHVLREAKLFPNEDDHLEAIRMLSEAGFSTSRGDNMDSSKQIGIKKLLSIIEMARQEPHNVAERLLQSLNGLKM